MAKNLEGDDERIDVLQEWAGYLLLPDASQQKFLFLEGEGSNGKSVYHAAVEAMLGEQNVSHVPLESFAERFSLYSTLGKLSNIAADCGELDKTAEGILKSFTSGDRMTFDRKGLSLVDATPTARLSIAANNRPQFKDRSSGLWRRMIVVPFRVQIEEHEKVKGMDKPAWWDKSGELSGILNWAIAGLHRLRLQRRFTESQIGQEALEEYRNESNSARAFLKTCCRACDAEVQTDKLYDAYKDWCKENGYHPVNERNFGKEVKRVFPNTEKHRRGTDGNRFHVYSGVFADGLIY
jgi:P4 family phage/plasmid primase-like protien